MRKKVFAIVAFMFFVFIFVLAALKLSNHKFTPSSFLRSTYLNTQDVIIDQDQLVKTYHTISQKEASQVRVELLPQEGSRGITATLQGEKIINSFVEVNNDTLNLHLFISDSYLAKRKQSAEIKQKIEQFINTIVVNSIYNSINQNPEEKQITAIMNMGKPIVTLAP